MQSVYESIHVTGSLVDEKMREKAFEPSPTAYATVVFTTLGLNLNIGPSFAEVMWSLS